MSSVLRYLFALFASLILAGCVSPVKVSDAETVITIKEQNVIDSEKARIIVVRDSGITAALLDAIIYLNNHKVAKLRPGQKAVFEVSPGLHIIGAGCQPCNEDYRDELQLVVVKGQDHVLRVSFYDGLRIRTSAMIRE
jgi:hypothetical protein